MPTYRYRFADLVTDRDLVELDLADVRFDRRICMPGTLRATIPIPNRAVADQVATILPRHDGDLSTGPGRTVVHVYRNGQIWGTYLIWSMTPASDARGRVSVALSGASLESYLTHREIRRDLIYSQVGDLDIARDLVADCEAHGPIGLQIAPGPPGTPRDRSYLASEAATYGERLQQLSEVLDGPEWMVRTYAAPDGRRVREFVVAQKLGQDDTDHVFTQPGDITGWEYPADATDAATSWQTRGDTPNQDVAAESQPLLSGIWADPRYAEAGWPLLERTVDYQGVTSVDTLNAYAAWWAEQRSGMLRIPKITVRLSEQSSFTPDRLGDYARIQIVNDWWPLSEGRPTFAKKWRIVGVEVTPVSRGTGQETATLIFEEPAGHPASTTAAARRGVA